LVILLATMAFHAFFGLAIMSGTGLLLADWYGAMGREWGPSAIADQQAGGGIAWGVGEVPTVILAIVVALMWARSDERESKRFDRKADRDGDAELTEYNAMLAKRGERP
jgi:putative copper resistance protein D